MARTRSAWIVTATAALGLLMAPTSVDVNAQGVDSNICTTSNCIANGDAECNRATATCPPCMYTISGGYSCYDKASGKCPFDDVLLTCPPKASPPPPLTPSPTVKPTTAPPTAAPVTDSPATVAPPQIDTLPATTAVSSTTSPPVTTTPAAASGSDGAPATGAGRPNSVQNNPTSSSTATSDSASSKTSGTSSSTNTTNSPSATDRSASTSDSSKVSTPALSPSAQAMDTSNGISSKKSSSLYVNVGVIVAAVAGVAIVAIFIVRRMKRQRDNGFLKTPEEGQKQFNLQVDRSTPGNGTRGATAASAGAGAAFAVAGGGINSAVAAANRGRRASSSSDAQSLLSMASLNSSTVEFANQHPPYGLPSQFGLPSEASSYARGFSASYASSAASSTTAGDFAQAARAPPPPRPQAIQEGDEFTLHSKRKQSVGVASATAVTPGGKSTTRPIHKPIYHESVRRVSSAISGNTYEDEYDIVHPRALQDADRRNTETLVMDGRFQSNFSEQDVRSVREDRFFTTKEHEI